MTKEGLIIQRIATSTMLQKLLDQIAMLENILATKTLSIYSQERIVYNIMDLEDQAAMVQQLMLEN